MTHLTDLELVDWLDGVLASSRARHLDECDHCRATAAQMRETLTRAAESDMPEPSPLFWEHFSARVHEAVAEAGPERSRWLSWTGSPTVKWAMSGALLTLLLVAGVWRATVPMPRSAAPPAPAVTIASSVPDGDLGVPDIDSDEAWAIVRTVADDLSWDDAAAEGIGVRQGSIEGAMASLKGEERSALVRLLEAETKQPGA